MGWHGKSPLGASVERTDGYETLPDSRAARAKTTAEILTTFSSVIGRLGVFTHRTLMPTFVLLCKRSQSQARCN